MELYSYRDNVALKLHMESCRKLGKIKGETEL